MRAGQHCGSNDFFERRIGLAEGDVFADRAAEQKDILRHDADLRAQAAERHLAEIVAIQINPPFIRQVHAQQQIGEGRLACAAASDQRDGLAGVDFQIDVLQRIAIRACRVAKRDILELQMPTHLGQVNQRLLRWVFFRFRVKDIVQPFERDFDFLHAVPEFD